MELDRWLKVPISNHDMAPREWWAKGDRRTQHPYLSRPAAHLFFIPMSSADAESALFQSGLTFGVLR